MSVYSPEAFGPEVSAEEWEEILTELNQELGDLESFRLVAANATSSGGRIEAELVYRTRYTEQDAEEVFFLVRDSRASDFRIVNHDITVLGKIAMGRRILNTVGTVVALIGGVALAVGGIWLLIVAFRESFLWGLGSLFPLVAIIFAVTHWTKAKRPFVIAVVGWIVATAGSFLAG